MFSRWLLSSCFILVFLTVGSRGNNHQDVVQSSATLDHEIYPHHSVMHSLLHKLQGYHPEQDLPQNWPATPRKIVYPIYYFYHLNHGPPFFVHKTERIGNRRFFIAK
ncbi:hypothetical protein DAPPUDRAFT_331774 [Daphnia pulex]|uniref:Secreted protein n=1 Tax=Daphnia pulex TaxID=6669 RepID=E9HNE3_DAPPU|nr:hypothetical protein DAPPUDRAFT_331774 [Daphnia pulex]|eukprot:EFX66762.1 hypothetical protein DAPPUDRAFT_331774 [Daphnia pulex]